ncbi:MAG: periplasmic nitrate reductase, NapE protein [Sneathiella sp.]
MSSCEAAFIVPYELVEVMDMEGAKIEDQTKKTEISLFLFLTFILIPALTIGVVGAYGFAIWVYQILYGGPPVG